jgi:hypothetical protein
MDRLAPTAAVVALFLAPTLLAGGPLTAIAVQGQPTPGSGGAPLASLNDPYTTRDGRVGFSGFVSLGGKLTEGIVWVDGAIVWRNSDALPVVLSGNESTMGISDDLSWIYSPSEGGNDSVWSDGAKVLTELDDAPGLPGLFITFCSRPQMCSNGAKTWISGITASQGSGAQFRALYRDNIVVLKGGDVVSGETLITAGTSVGFNYDFSSLATNYICRGVIAAPNASNDVIVANGAIIARESFSSGEADNWQNFGDVKTNELGDIAFSGDTDAATTADGYLAFNDELIVREGQNLAGFTLTGNPSAVGLNDLRQVGAIWSHTTGEILFVYTPTQVASQLDVIMRTGDQVDLDGDGDADGVISDFNASQGVAPGLDLPRQCRVYANVDVELIGGGSVIAIVGASLPAAPGLTDLDGDGTVGGADLAILLGSWDGPGISDLNCDGTTDAADLAILLGAWS